MAKRLKTLLRERTKQRLLETRLMISGVRLAAAVPKRPIVAKLKTKPYRCGKCSSFGHNARTCGKQR